MNDFHGGRSRSARVFPIALALAYAGLIVYASLFPFQFVSIRFRPGAPWWYLRVAFPLHYDQRDVLANVVAYVPLGLLLRWCFRRLPIPLQVVFATILGTALSLTMECLQTLIPRRSPSKVDLVTNAIGALLGAVLGVLIHFPVASGQSLRDLRHRIFLSGPVTDLSLLAVGFWMLSQWTPFVPWAVTHQPWNFGLGFLLSTPPGQFGSHFSVTTFVGFATSVAGIGLVGSRAFRNHFAALTFMLVAIVLTVAVKPLVATRYLRLEEVWGLFLGLVLLSLFERQRRKTAIAIVLVAAAFLVTELAPGRGPSPRFNWTPLLGQFQDPIGSFPEILEAVWPIAALASLTANWTRKIGIAGGIGIAVLIGTVTLVLELFETKIPGRHGDVTTVIFGVAAWLFAWAWVHGERSASRPH